MKWEDICTRCGLCCHEKVVLPDCLLIDMDAACSFYDRETGLCTVYEDRFNACPRCLKVTPLRAMAADYLPPSCAYVRWAERHHLRFARKREMVIKSG